MAYLEKITKNGKILGFNKSFWTRDELAFFEKHEAQYKNSHKIMA